MNNHNPNPTKQIVVYARIGAVQQDDGSIEQQMGLYIREAENHLQHMHRWANYPTLVGLFRASGIPLGYWSYPDPNDPSTPQDPKGQYEVRLETTKRDARQGNFDLVVTYEDVDTDPDDEDALNWIYENDYQESAILALYQAVLTQAGVPVRYIEYDETSGIWPQCDTDYLRIEGFGQGQEAAR